MAEQRLAHAQPVFPEPRKLRKPEREPCIIAEKAQVPQMLADALSLEQQRAQPQRSWRRRGPGDAFDRHRVGPGVRHCGIARHASREPGALGERHRLEALLDALVLVAEPLLQAQDTLANDGEAKMPRFDGAGVHRSYRDLMYPLPFNTNKRIVIGLFCSRFQVQGSRFNVLIQAESPKFISRRDGSVSMWTPSEG